MDELELEDIQGLIARGYEKLTCASFLLLKINEAGKAKKYLQYLLTGNHITPAKKESVSPEQLNLGLFDKALHIAFTSRGLAKLGLDKESLESFSREFTEGMVDRYRSILLGDTQDNDPAKWIWGTGNNKVDLMLLCYASKQEKLNQLLNEQKSRLEASDIEIIRQQDTHETLLSKYGIFVEHFGFRDGISSPFIKELKPTKEGLSKPSPIVKQSNNADKETNRRNIKPGEFILGYENEYGVYPDSPTIEKTKDKENNLKEKHNEPGKKDLGRNGTYLVYRQIEQKVFRFWQYLKENSKEDGISAPDSAIKLASKMVGRWPGGAPLALSDYDDPSKSNAKYFSYAKNDPDGIKCPFGAHIRRTNPRDQIHSGRTVNESQQMVRKHQMLRRGRIYGKPIVESMKPEDILELEKDDEQERGLHFICLVTNISRQFEFIQNVWANNFVFADLCNEVDPLISPRPAQKEPFCNEFTVQGNLLKRCYKNIPQFTQVVGGAYFFLPGLQALKVIASLE